MKRFSMKILKRILSIKDDTDGFAVMLTLSIFLFLFVLCAAVYAVGETIHQKIRLQNACDAAAYSAAVVQADGLSRMATINRAMSWTYVQMTNHQMDYITYRWLKLTTLRFEEDKANAQAWHRHLVAGYYKELGWWALIITAGDALTGRLLGARCNRDHNKEGIGWWCGIGPSDDNMNKVKLNGPYVVDISELKNVVASFGTQFDNAVVSVLGGESGAREEEPSVDTSEDDAVREGEETVPSDDTDDNHEDDDTDSEEDEDDYQDFLDDMYGTGDDKEEKDDDDDESKDNPELKKELKGISNRRKEDVAALREEMLAKIETEKQKIMDEYQQRINELDKEDPDYDNQKKAFEDERDEKIEKSKQDIEKEYKVKWNDINTRYDNQADEVMGKYQMAGDSQSQQQVVNEGDITEQDMRNAQDVIDQYNNFIAQNANQSQAKTESDQDLWSKAESMAYDEFMNNSDDLISILNWKYYRKRKWPLENKKNHAWIKNYKDTAKGQERIRFFYSQLLEQQQGQSVQLQINHPPITPEPTLRNWGKGLAQLIDADKENIALMNAMLSVVNRNMNTAMRSTAEFVLVSMLKDPRKKKDESMKNYMVYFSIPMGQDPYSTEEAGDKVARPLFAPLYNTEPCERLFLQMNSSDHANQPLYMLFPIGKGTDSRWGFKGFGVDQWFVRGTRNPEGNMPTTIRSEGALGLQRSYKDANLNETESGVVEGIYKDAKVDRGNHIASVVFENYSLEKEKEDKKTGGSSGFGKKLIADVINPITNMFANIAETYCDINPSAGNKQRPMDSTPKNSDEYKHLGMCLEDSQNVALVSQYDWASGKWLCLNKPKYATFWADYLYCKFFVGRCKHKRIYCDYAEIKHGKKWRAKIRHKGYGHYHLPKWFCGYKPRYEGDGHISPSVAKYTLVDMLPPLVSTTTIKERNHGYMGKTTDMEEFVRPFSPLWKGETETTRLDYRSCAAFMDGIFNYDYTNGGTAAIIKGHARIYGDDQEIWDEARYIGETAKPWILHENFFNGLGTIVIGAAMKHENPFVQLFNLLGSDKKELSKRSVLSAFDPPSYAGGLVTNYIWTMAAARAAVHRTRRGGPYDGNRMYQVVYDPSSDPRNLSIRTAFRYDPNNNWDPDNDWQPYELYEAQNANTAHDPDTVDILGGCVCDGNQPICNGDNTKKFKYMWNLCEQDWDATLLPLRYAGAAATMQDKGQLFSDMTHQERLFFINRLTLKEIGKGTNWTWSPAPVNETDMGNANPLNPDSVKRSWQPLDPENEDTLNLENFLPGEGSRMLDLNKILKQNRIL